MRSESSEEQKQAAQQALHHHCQQLLDPTHSHKPSNMQLDTTPVSPTPPAPNLTHDTPSTQQLALIKPCAWPFPVTASHFADNAAMATLARDAALWESYTAQLAALYLTQADPASVSVHALQQASPPLQALLPADLLHGLHQNSGRGIGLKQRLLEEADSVTEMQPQLHLLWQAAACFAERASDVDKDVRWQWALLTAAQMKVNAVMSEML